MFEVPDSDWSVDAASIDKEKKELHIRAAVRINGRPILNGGPEYIQKSQILTRVMQPQIQSLFPSDNL